MMAWATIEGGRGHVWRVDDGSWKGGRGVLGALCALIWGGPAAWAVGAWSLRIC